MKPELRGALVEALGRGTVGDGDLVTPRSADEVATTCRLCHERGIPVTLASGGGGQRGVVAGVLVSLRALDSISVDEERRLVRAGAGATLAAVAAAAGQAGLVLAAAGEARGERLGSALALGAVPRRAVLALDLVLSSGVRVRTGSELAKDVTGYDLTALLLGSRGSLAVIVAASLRLVPQGSLSPGADAGYPLARGGREGRLTAILRRAFDPAGELRPDLER